MNINGIGNGYGLGQAFPTQGNESKNNSPAADAGKFFGELVSKVNELQTKSDQSVQQLLTGESKGLHEVMIAMEESNVSFQFLTQVRNKALEAYQEIMRMQV
jgi:flagellar hook-basal body complex protein FliE